MRVHGDANVVRGRAILEGQHDLGDELRYVWSNEVRAEELVGSGVSNEFYEAGVLAHRTRSSVGAEREAANTILTAAILHLALSEANGSDLRPRVDDVRDRAVVHVHVLPGDHLSGDDAFVLRLVREHRSRHAVADRIDVRHAGPHAIVDKDFAATAEGQTNGGGIETAKRWLAADGDECVVAVERFFRAVFLDIDENAIAIASAAHDARAGAELETLTSEDAVAFLDDVVVHAGENGGHELD